MELKDLLTNQDKQLMVYNGGGLEDISRSKPVRML